MTVGYKTHGGARPGAGRKPSPPQPIAAEALAAAGYRTPEAFLKDVMNSSDVDGKLRVDAAKALLNAKMAKARKVAPAGKKAERVETAARVANKFAHLVPQLKVVG